jgi:hypothetical protein
MAKAYRSLVESLDDQPSATTTVWRHATYEQERADQRPHSGFSGLLLATFRTPPGFVLATRLPQPCRTAA